MIFISFDSVGLLFIVQEFCFISPATFEIHRNLLNFSVALFQPKDVDFSLFYMQIGVVIYNAEQDRDRERVMHDCFFDSFHLKAFGRDKFPFIRSNSSSYDDFHQWYANFFLSSTSLNSLTLYFIGIACLLTVFECRLCVELLNLHLLMQKEISLLRNPEKNVWIVKTNTSNLFSQLFELTEVISRNKFRFLWI